jgi:hypothetical protein
MGISSSAAAVLGRLANVAVTATIIAAMWLLRIELRQRRRLAPAAGAAPAPKPKQTKPPPQRHHPIMDFLVFVWKGSAATLFGAVLGLVCKPGGIAHVVSTLILCTPAARLGCPYKKEEERCLRSMLCRCMTPSVHDIVRRAGARRREGVKSVAKSGTLNL